jgi:hypothetical protein
MKKQAESGAGTRPSAGKIVDFPGRKRGIRALSARTRDGRSYIRFDEVERQIERFADAPVQTWPSVVREGLDGHSVKNETIVYLIHESWRLRHDNELLDLHSFLFDRMATMVLNRAAKMGLSDASPLLEFVHNRIIEQLYDDSGSAATDFLEVAFNRAVACEIQKWNRKHGKYWQRLDIDAEIPEESVVQHSIALSAASIEQIEAGISADNIIANARKWLASPHFEAFYLHYVKRIPVVPKKGSKLSLVQHFRRPASTIYFWLDRAVRTIREKLSERPEA